MLCDLFFWLWICLVNSCGPRWRSSALGLELPFYYFCFLDRAYAISCYNYAIANHPNQHLGQPALSEKFFLLYPFIERQNTPKRCSRSSPRIFGGFRWLALLEVPLSYWRVFLSDGRPSFSEGLTYQSSNVVKVFQTIKIGCTIDRTANVHPGSHQWTNTALHELMKALHDLPCCPAFYASQ